MTPTHTGYMSSIDTDPTPPSPALTRNQIRLRVFAALVAIGCGVAALLVAILLVRGVLA
jgi:hypothetical protein